MTLNEKIDELKIRAGHVSADPHVAVGQLAVLLRLTLELLREIVREP